MTRKLLDELGRLQRSVIEVLWERDHATVHDVRDALSERGRTPAYTTILSVLQKLEKAGWVRHRRDGRTYLYSARRSREEEGVQSLRGFVNRVFEGDPLQLFQHLLEDERIGDDELAALRRMIDRRKKEDRDDA